MHFIGRSIFSSGSAELAIGILILLSSYVATGQKKCGIEEYRQMLLRDNLLPESDEKFEHWISEKLNQSKSENKNSRKQSNHYLVQVVVHVIHNGEDVGEGANISDEQILSQINVLNRDFKRLNQDAVLTPEEFKSVAGEMHIDFILARQDPLGQPTTGINRVKGTRSSWTIKENSQLKSLSYWPAENYINIWVCELTDFYGFTQFPISTLSGLENSSRNRLTDGIIISNKVFGSNDYGSFDLEPAYNKGRALTHEMGHFFGLRHPWGDVEGCGGTDYVSDTPPQAQQSFGCPQHPVKECPADNPVNKMFQNYMDFTNDACMNLFTVGQVNRMKVVLENSPRRASLLFPIPLIDESFPIRKVFSPNGDGVNDYWLWENTLMYEGCKLLIFNRFGKLVYEKTSYDNTWDGKSSDGKVLEEEAYYYIVKCNGKADLTGGVRIVR